jgi:hypothetical protein
MTKLTCIFLFAAAAWAQNDSSKPAAPLPEFFRLDFSLKELESGKLVNTRSYQTMAVSGNNVASIRSGGRVPVNTGTDKAYTYIDIGVNIDVRRVTRVNEELNLDVTAEISGSVEPNEHPALPPVIRQTRWNSVVAVPMRKATVLFTSDDPASKRQLQLEMTATPVH